MDKNEIMDKILLPYRDLGVDTQYLKFELGNDFFSCLANPELLSGDVKVEIKALKINAGVKLNLKIEGVVDVECDRCLESCPIEICVESDVAVREGELSEDYDQDTLWISSSDNEIDLTQYIYESIMLALPYQRVHGVDKNGDSLCNKEMLDKFKIVSDQEFEQIISDNNKSNNPQWAKLEELKEKLNK